MSIYDELNALAVARATHRAALQFAHEQAGARLTASLAAHLGGPPDRVQYAEPVNPGYPFPTVRPGGDGFYYFELSIVFTNIPPGTLAEGFMSRYPLELGIRQDEGDRFTVRLPTGELNTPVSLDKADDLQRFCDAVIDRIRKQISAERGEFGFRFPVAAK